MNTIIMEKLKEMIKCSMGRDNLLYFNNQDNDTIIIKQKKFLKQSSEGR